MYNFEKLYFIYPKSFTVGSTLMMLYQAFIVCRNLGVPSSVLHISELDIPNIKNSGIFVLKHCLNQRDVHVLKNNNNRIVLIPGDGNISQVMSQLRNIQDVDGVIVASDQYRKRINNLGKFKTKIIGVHYDYFLDSDIFKSERESSFKLYYGGNPNPNMPTQGDYGIPNDVYRGFFKPMYFAVKDIPFGNYGNIQNAALDTLKSREATLHINSMDNPSRYSCHYSVRCPIVGDTSDFWEAKSATKLCVAAGSGANIITALEPCNRVYIDENYPYSIDTESQSFLENPIDSCHEMVEYAKATYKTKTWYDGLRIMEDVKKKSSATVITKQYIAFANELFER